MLGVQPGDTLLILGDEETGIIVTKPDAARRGKRNFREDGEIEMELTTMYESLVSRAVYE